MSENTYLKDSVKKCVDYAMEQNDEAKRRIFTGLFEYTDRLVNESITVKALNDEEKKKWFDNEMFNTYEIEIERLNNIINELKDFLTSYKEHRNSFKWNEQDYIDTIEEIEKIMEGSDK